MGRTRKPTPLKVVGGTDRKDRSNPSEPQPEVKIPEMPAHLSEDAKAEWERITPLLDEMGIISDLDLSALAMYCQAYGRHIEAERKILETGLLDTTSNGNTIQSPLVGISNHSMEIARKLLATFGMTPADRSKVNAVPRQPDKPEGKERFFK
ncbi:phage terminase small subunit P27 family [Geomonas nitrogeniifigens]|uniref:phage terminase small subunit P27 family n=1 Tax=Geomonas diazotrophica TaxID=2843197 RepID=UPI001C2C25DE|nr:phage terminase small subunit P27 family [Geomonas nitrogeniifigens]QXE85985.1 phage terminase small subunit P27 family [Geomonas nitrogeniifigens]